VAVGTEKTKIIGPVVEEVPIQVIDLKNQPRPTPDGVGPATGTSIFATDLDERAAQTVRLGPTPLCPLDQDFGRLQPDRPTMSRPEIRTLPPEVGRVQAQRSDTPGDV